MNDLLNAELIRRLQNSHPELSKAKLKLRGGILEVLGHDPENSDQIFELRNNLDFCLNLKTLGILHLKLYNEKLRQIFSLPVEQCIYLIANQPKLDMRTGQWKINPIDNTHYLE